MATWAIKMNQMDQKTTGLDFVKLAKVKLVVTYSFRKKCRMMRVVKQLRAKLVGLQQELLAEQESVKKSSINQKHQMKANSAIVLVIMGIELVEKHSNP